MFEAFHAPFRLFHVFFDFLSVAAHPTLLSRISLQVSISCIKVASSKGATSIRWCMYGVVAVPHKLDAGLLLLTLTPCVRLIVFLRVVADVISSPFQQHIRISLAP
ncbi:hypothetical protein ONS96_008988 [Cadophora gregata f. sp. sojae]|nr:hypothetical protein ONS96_008988 [Cadophora gregata f. sp. sojae]